LILLLERQTVHGQIEAQEMADVRPNALKLAFRVVFQDSKHRSADWHLRDGADHHRAKVDALHFAVTALPSALQARLIQESMMVSSTVPPKA